WSARRPTFGDHTAYARGPALPPRRPLFGGSGRPVINQTRDSWVISAAARDHCLCDGALTDGSSLNCGRHIAWVTSTRRSMASPSGAKEKAFLHILSANDRVVIAVRRCQADGREVDRSSTATYVADIPC